MACADDSDEDFISCGVCFHNYDTENRKPKILQCSHTLCLQCLKAICRGGSITCPFCRKTNAIDDINAVPTNSYAIHFLKRIEKKEENFVGLSTVKMTTDAIKDLDAMIHLKEELMQLKNHNTDTVDVAIKKRKQVNEKLDTTSKSIKSVLERIGAIQDENSLQLTEMVEWNRKNKKKVLSLSELINLVDDSTSEDTADTLRLKMAKSADRSQQKLSEATALASGIGRLPDFRTLLADLATITTATPVQHNSETNQVSLQRISVDRDKKLAAEKKLFEWVKETRPNIKELNDLMKEGADINCRDEEGMTPFLLLMLYSYEKDNLEEFMVLLISYGADVKVKEKKGNNALHLLCRTCEEENLIKKIRILIEHGINVQEKSIGLFEMTALHLVCWQYQKANLIEIIKLLIQNGASANGKNNRGSTALHYVCRHYRRYNLKEIIKLLIDNGADVKAKTTEEFTALDFLNKRSDSIKNKEEIMKILGNK